MLGSRLDLEILDTGSMYRAATWLAMERGIVPEQHELLQRVLRESKIVLGERVTVDGIDVTDAIRGKTVTDHVSAISAVAEVRAILVERQRQWVAERGGGVVEGRDIGTVVFPDATLKIFMTAPEELRPERRLAQDGAREERGSVEAAQRALAERDERDRTRTVAPLRPAADAILIDSASGSPDVLVDRVLELLATRTGIGNCE